MWVEEVVTRLPTAQRFRRCFRPQLARLERFKLWKQDVRFFMPRIGIAYRPSDKWVFRIGGGMFDNINHLNNFTILNLMPPKSGSLIYTSVTDASPNDTCGWCRWNHLQRADSPVSCWPAGVEFE